MIQLRFTHTVALSLLLALSLAWGCSSNRSRGRTVDSGTPTDSAVRPDAPTGDSGTTDSGGTVDTGTPGGQGDQAVAGYRMVVESDCAVAHRCRSSLMTYLPDATDADFIEVFGNDESTCVTLGYSTEVQALLRSAVDEGRIQYDALSVGPCVSVAGSTSCEEFWMGTSSVPACDAILRGTVPNGSACRISAECVSVSCPDGFCSDPAP